jgi:membrane fusion protein (multidrug efflux system)
VRIALEASELIEHPLRIGLSTVVYVDTRDRRGAVLAAAPPLQPASSTAIYADDYAAAERAADALIAGQPLIKP